MSYLKDQTFELYHPLIILNFVVISLNIIILQYFIMLFYVNFVLKHCVKQNFIKVYKSNVTYFNLVSFSCKETYFKTNFELKLICFQIRDRETSIKVDENIFTKSWVSWSSSKSSRDRIKVLPSTARKCKNTTDELKK